MLAADTAVKSIEERHNEILKKHLEEKLPSDYLYSELKEEKRRKTNYPSLSREKNLQNKKDVGINLLKIKTLKYQLFQQVKA